MSRICSKQKLEFLWLRTIVLGKFSSKLVTKDALKGNQDKVWRFHLKIRDKLTSSSFQFKFIKNKFILQEFCKPHVSNGLFDNKAVSEDKTSSFLQSNPQK